MIPLLRRMLNLDALDTVIDVATKQQDLIRQLQQEIRVKAELIEEYKRGQNRQHLAHTRSIRDLVEHFFIAQEAGLDVREELEKGLSDLQDEVARQEEHFQR